MARISASSDELWYSAYFRGRGEAECLRGRGEAECLRGRSEAECLQGRGKANGRGVGILGITVWFLFWGFWDRVGPDFAGSSFTRRVQGMVCCCCCSEMYRICPSSALFVCMYIPKVASFVVVLLQRCVYVQKVDVQTAQAIDAFLTKLNACAKGDQAFTFVIDDSSGNSYIENSYKTCPFLKTYRLL
jgi:hypothetical protein